VRGFAAAAHYFCVDSQSDSFAVEAALMRESAGVSVTDAICRMPRLRRVFAAQAEQIRRRLDVLEAADRPAGRRLTRRMIGWFWCAVFLLSALSFGGGYLVALRL